MATGAFATPALPFDLAPDVVTVHDDAGSVLWASSACQQLLGRPPDDLLGGALLPLVHPEDRAGLAARLAGLRDEPGGVQACTTRLLHADGTYRTVESRARRHLHDGHLRCVVVSSRDVTDRAAASAQLAASEARHRHLVERLPVGVCVVDVDGLVRFANPAALVFSGQPDLADVLGRPVVAFVEPPDRDRCRAAFRSALVDRQTPAAAEYRLLRPDGVPLVVLSAPLPYDWQGEPAALVLLQDVTALRTAEAETATASRLMTRILEASAEGVVGLDDQGRVTLMNPAAADLLGLDAEAVRGAFGHALYHHSRPGGQPYPAAVCPCLVAARGGVPADIEGDVFWRADGTPMPVAYRVIPLSSAPQSGAVLTFHDVTERDAARARQAREDHFRRAVLDSLPALTAVVDQRGTIVAVNAAWLEHMQRWGGRSQACGVGANVLEVCDRVTGPPQAQTQAATTAAGLRRVLAGSLHEHRGDVDSEDDGTGTCYSLSVVPLESNGGGAVLAYTDISERKRLEVQAAHRATHDVLTGLPNRRLLLDRLGQALSVRGGPHVGVLFLDLDGFKLVNDGYGHEAGDDLLRQLGGRLQAHVRPEDTVARLAGDEFVVLCTSLAGPQEAEELARRLLRASSEPFTIGPTQILLAMSVGIALADDELDEPAALLQAADQAMFDAKASGRGRYRVYDRAVHGRNHLRLAQAGVLRRLVEHGGLLVHYQPVIDLRDGRVASAEALLRWHYSVDLPDTATAIALAEEIGLIGRIGRFVVQEAMRQGATFVGRDGAVLPLAVNIAPQELDDTLVDSVEASAAATGYPLSSLTLELTERSVMADPGRAISVLRSLRARGVQIALDDFGVGHSSLASLRDLPLDVLKIDAGFVRGLRGEGADSRIITAILQMARALHLDVVAEGVEHAEQRDRLLELGCERAQGWLFSAARTPESLRTLSA